jgi:hypothetical protein
MVLELRPPEGVELDALLPLAPKIPSYVLSFVIVAATGTTTIICCRLRRPSAAASSGQSRGDYGVCA